MNCPCCHQPLPENGVSHPFTEREKVMIIRERIESESGFELGGRRGREKISDVRFMAMAIAAELTSASHREIGNAFNRTKWTAAWARSRATNLLKIPSPMRGRYVDQYHHFKSICEQALRINGNHKPQENKNGS